MQKNNLMRVLLLILFVLSFNAYGQRPCEFKVDTQDSLGVYKATKQVLMHERQFGGSSTYLYFSLVLSNELPSLNLQIVQKSKEFIKAYCLDSSSRIYLQLDNGKVIPLLHIDAESCSNSVFTNDGYNNRILNSYFLFPAGTMTDLKSSAVSLLRIKFSGETADYIIKSELISETDKSISQPADFFRNYLHCVHH